MDWVQIIKMGNSTDFGICTGMLNWWHTRLTRRRCSVRRGPEGLRVVHQRYSQ